MANCNDHFETYHDKLKLTKARKDNLVTSRDDLRTKIEKWFKQNKEDEEQPEFESQGSMETDTIVNPIPRKVIESKKEKTKLYYDVDDGVYFKGDKGEDERPTPQTYHSWICQAVKGHTDKDPIDKNTCVRTVFSDGHHVDHPIYYQKGDCPELAHKKDGYILSEPAKFTRWFNDKVDKDEQLRRIVRYLKGWCDFRHYSNSQKKMPSGLIMTILAAENIVYRKNRDDISLKETLISIRAKLRTKFECKRPTTPEGENLLSAYANEDYFMDCLTKFIEGAEEALKDYNYRSATESWRKYFGDRFPLGEDKEENSSANSGLAAIIPSNTRPYSD